MWLLLLQPISWACASASPPVARPEPAPEVLVLGVELAGPRFVLRADGTVSDGAQTFGRLAPDGTFLRADGTPSARLLPDGTIVPIAGTRAPDVTFRIVGTSLVLEEDGERTTFLSVENGVLVTASGRAPVDGLTAPLVRTYLAANALFLWMVLVG